MRRVWNRFWRGGVLGRDLQRQSLHSGESFGFRWRLLLYYFGDLVPAASEYGVCWEYLDGLEFEHGYSVVFQSVIVRIDRE